MANPMEKMVGPLPVGGWIAVVGGGLALAYFVNRNLGDGGGLGDEDLAPVVLEPVGGTQPVVDNAPRLPSGGTGSDTDDLIDNEDWLNAATQALAARGYSSVTVIAALTDFLGGRPLSPAERGVVDEAIKIVGPPPTPPRFVTPEALVTTPKPTPLKPSSNRQWIEMALPAVKKRLPQFSRVRILRVLQRYLARGLGAIDTPAERAIINAALAALGPPPQLPKLTPKKKRRR